MAGGATIRFLRPNMNRDSGRTYLSKALALTPGKRSTSVGGPGHYPRSAKAFCGWALASRNTEVEAFTRI